MKKIKLPVHTQRAVMKLVRAEVMHTIEVAEIVRAEQYNLPRGRAARDPRWRNQWFGRKLTARGRWRAWQARVDIEAGLRR